VTPVTKGRRSFFVYVASVTPRAAMRYEWITPPGMTGTRRARRASSSLSFTAVAGSVSGCKRSSPPPKFNVIEDFAPPRRRPLTVFSAPTTFTSHRAEPTSPRRAVPGHRRLHVHRATRCVASEHVPVTADNLTINGTSTGGNDQLHRGVPRSGRDPKAAALHVAETNGAGILLRARGMARLPAPATPVIRITALGSTRPTAQTSRPGLAAPSITLSRHTFACDGHDSNPSSQARRATFDFTGTNADPLQRRGLVVDVGASKRHRRERHFRHADTGSVPASVAPHDVTRCARRPSTRERHGGRPPTHPPPTSPVSLLVG